mgnify:CR=1 FL=1
MCYADLRNKKRDKYGIVGAIRENCRFCRVTHIYVGADLNLCRFCRGRPDHSRFCRGRRPPARDHRTSIGAAALCSTPLSGPPLLTHASIGAAAPVVARRSTAVARDPVGAVGSGVRFCRGRRTQLAILSEHGGCKTAILNLQTVIVKLAIPS